MARIELDLAHAYKPQPKTDSDYALLPMSMCFEDGGAYALLGPSGCGKTTTLRMIAGFVEATSGRVLIGDEDVTELPPYRRNTGMVFQGYALFPHMTVFGNVAFGLQLMRRPKDEIARRVAGPLEDVPEGLEVAQALAARHARACVDRREGPRMGGRAHGCLCRAGRCPRSRRR